MLKSATAGYKIGLIKPVTYVFLISFFVLMTGLNGDLFGSNEDLTTRISFDKNPVLISDSLETIDAKILVKSSQDKLSENIYFSSLNNYFFLSRIFDNYTLGKANTDFLEILGLNEFYRGNRYKSVEILTDIFNNTTDSSQKAKICLNLININYLNNQPTEAMYFVKQVKDSLDSFYNYNQRYNLLFTEAKIALTQGMTTKAENLMIQQVLPMSSKATSKHSEFDCYLFLGKIYLKAKQFTQAKWFFIQANTIAVNQNYIDGEIETSLLLAKTKIKVGDNAVALQDLARARKLIDKSQGIYLADLQQLTHLARR
ncbi:MAG TPA: hypothetical protein VL125_11090 [Pelobium sp.]|nr:hypothetical protein [Pelobium sp.]